MFRTPQHALTAFALATLLAACSKPAEVAAPAAPAILAAE